MTSHQRELPGLEAAEAGAVGWPAKARAGRPLLRWEHGVGRWLGKELNDLNPMGFS